MNTSQKGDYCELLVLARLVKEGPKDYRDQVADDRPAYAWAILHELGYLK